MSKSIYNGLTTVIQQGPAGNIGPQGPAGPAGPTGAQGPAASNIITSVFSRTGAVTAQANDYNINQLAGTSITSPIYGQMLGYNGANFINLNSDGYIYVNSYSPTIAAEPYYFYQVHFSVTITAPTAPMNGCKFGVRCGESTTTINFSANVYSNSAAYTTGSCTVVNNGDNGVIEFVYFLAESAWSMVSVQGNFYFNGSQVSTPRTFSEINGLSITTPVANNVLTYNGTNWVNTANIGMPVQNETSSFTAVKNTIYNVYGPNTIVATLPDATGVNGGDRITFIVTVNGSFTLQCSPFGFFNYSGDAATGLGVSATPSSGTTSISLMCSQQQGQVGWTVMYAQPYWNTSDGHTLGQNLTIPSNLNLTSVVFSNSWRIIENNPVIDTNFGNTSLLLQYSSNSGSTWTTKTGFT